MKAKKMTKDEVVNFISKQLEIAQCKTLSVKTESESMFIEIEHEGTYLDLFDDLKKLIDIAKELSEKEDETEKIVLCGVLIQVIKGAMKDEQGLTRVALFIYGLQVCEIAKKK